MKRPATERSVSAVTAEVIGRVLARPGGYTTSSLASELGEAERRIQRVMAEIDGSGWTVERAGNWGLTLRQTP